MLRVAAWTCGLFVVAGAIVHFFPSSITEPLVLIVLGATLFLVSGRAPAQGRQDEDATPAGGGLPTLPTPTPAPTRITR